MAAMSTCGDVHTTCEDRIKKFGGKATCCYCDPHPGCWQNPTWTCHVCYAERPDANISVFVRDISAQFKLPKLSAVQNVRYCNDNADCIVKSKSILFFKDIKDK